MKKIQNDNSICLLSGGIGDILKSLPFLTSDEGKKLKPVVMSHQQSAEELLRNLGVELEKFILFKDLDGQNAELNKMKISRAIYNCPRYRYFDLNPFLTFNKYFNNNKKTIGIHVGGSSFSIEIQKTLKLPEKNLPLKLIVELSRLDFNFLIFGLKSELIGCDIDALSNVRVIEGDKIYNSLSFVSQCDLFVGSDSAFKTLAAMLKIPTMVWMGDYPDKFRNEEFIDPYVSDGVMDVFRYKNLYEGDDFDVGVSRTLDFIYKSLFPDNNKVWTSLFNSSFGSIILNVRDKGVSGDILKYGYFENDHIQLLISLTRYLLGRKRNVTIYDVGANIGTHTLALAKINPDRVLVRSFEAQSKVFYMLCGTVALNGLGNVHCHNNVVGEDNFKFIKMKIPDYSGNYNFGGFEVKDIAKSDNQDMEKPFIERIQMITLDSFNESVDILKIDVEGMEESVLSGAVQIFESSRPICFIEYFKSNRENIFKFFRDRKYIGYATHQDLLAVPESMDIQINGLQRVF